MIRSSARLGALLYFLKVSFGIFQVPIFERFNGVVSPFVNTLSPSGIVTLATCGVFSFLR